MKILRKVNGKKITEKLNEKKIPEKLNGKEIPERLNRKKILERSVKCPTRLHNRNKRRMSNEQERNQFEVKLNLSSFHANDLQVNVHDRELIVSGHHDEREEGGSMIKRHFVRTYTLPRSAKEEQLTSALSADGILKITVPINEATEYRKIPIKVDPNWKMHSNPCQELILREPIPLWWW
uniref:SHSP domain-containing protein n=1 Tax=Wuchereria bancrofti TaxID=6293 RepID=A0A1I8EB69_WUCBA